MPVTRSSNASATIPAVDVVGTEEQARALFGKFCPRCERNALFGIECSHCGHVIITALVSAPCHPPAWSAGCCPVCFTADPEVWEVHGRLLCTTCAEGRSRWGDRVKAAPGWRGRARRVLAWVDEPGSLSFATQYADETVGR